MNGWDGFWLGIVEGLTEFLPVSSTGHLILAADLLGLSGDDVKTLEVGIQLGAVLAVAGYFRHKLRALLGGLVRRDPAAMRLTSALALAFVPAAVLGLLFHKAIKERLFGPGPVAAALVVGGVIMIAVELAARRLRSPVDSVDGVDVRAALAIGLAQCCSLWPGTSRSMATIVGGRVAGLTNAAAAEFSFLLAIPTLGAACAYDLLKNGAGLMHGDNRMALLVGLATSTVVAWLVVAGFLRYLKRWGLTPFGIYRILVGVVVLAWPGL